MVIITEDSGSGLKLWEAIKSTYLPDRHDVKIISARGVDNVSTIIETIEPRIKQGETLILALDMTESKSITGILEKIERTGIAGNCLIAGYYCSEEVFLSFKYLTDWCNARKYSTLANDLMVKLLNPEGMDYSEDMPQSLIQFLANYRESHPGSRLKRYNREQLSGILLAEITKESGKRFYISKSKLGACWWNDCNTVVSKTSVAYCSKCGLSKTLECRPTLAKDKIEALRLYSILAKASIPFKDLAKYK